MSVTDEDDEQNQRLARLEAGQSSLGRSLDQVRDAFTGHESECQENWRDQRTHNTKVESHIKFQRWLGAALLTGVAGIVGLLIEHFLGKL